LNFRRHHGTGRRCDGHGEGSRCAQNQNRNAKYLHRIPRIEVVRTEVLKMGLLSLDASREQRVDGL